MEEQRKTSYVKNNMYDIDCKIGPGSSGLSCVCVITRESETILLLFLLPSFLFWIKIYNTFCRSSIIKAELFRDLALRARYDNYHK